MVNKTRKAKVQKTGSKSNCQCSGACKNKTLKGKHFCEQHSNSCPRVSPLSGFEPDYDPEHWNNKYHIKETHNCFAYAFNINDENQMKKCNDPKCDVPFHQPGIAAGYPRFKSSKPKTCPNMMARLFGDNPNIKMSSFEEKCPIGTSKIALIVDENEDYHFLRQDSNKYWSHKPGARKVTNKDAAGRLIYDPALADYNYMKNSNGYLNYDTFCSYMCVPRITPVRLKVGGKNTNFVKLVVLYTRKNDDPINLDDCNLDTWSIEHHSSTQTEGYNYKVVFTGSKETLDQFSACIEKTFDSYKKNKVIKKYKIGVLTN